MMKVHWKGKHTFEGVTPGGNRFTMDSPNDDGPGNGPSPLEVFLASGAACSGIDVITILEKKRQKVTGYRIEIDGDRVPEGTYPRPFTAIRFRHIVEGEDLDPLAVEQAVKLSSDKYCSVIATLRSAPAVESVFEVRSAVSKA